MRTPRRSRVGGLLAATLVGAGLIAGGGLPAAHASTTAAAGSAAAASSASAGVPSQSDCRYLLSVPCLTPSQLETAYDETPLLAAGVTGKGSTICIVDSFGSPTIARDVDAFSSANGLPKPSLTIVTPAGRIPAYDGSYDRAGWAGETSLDVEWSHAMAPGARIVLVETPTSETEGIHGFPEIAKAISWTIAHEPCSVISQSYGATEETFSSSAQVLKLRSEMVLPAVRRGITLLASSGDYGATDLRLDATSLYGSKVDSWPSTDPLVTSVGGTRITLNAAGKRTAADTAWGGDAGTDAAGGGLSTIFSRPAFQNGVAHTVGSHRGTPDISLDAAPESSVLTYESFPANTSPGIGNWRVEAGTSASTPMFAGIVALAVQEAGHRLGWINPALYGALAGHGNAVGNGILDVTRGTTNVVAHQNDDGSTISVRGYKAIRGYDLATGLGTIDAARFVPALAAAAGH